MLGKGLLDQAVFAVDVGDHGVSTEGSRNTGHGCEGPFQIELCEVSGPQHRFQLRLDLRP